MHRDNTMHMSQEEFEKSLKSTFREIHEKARLAVPDYKPVRKRDNKFDQIIAEIDQMDFPSHEPEPIKQPEEESKEASLLIKKPAQLDSIEVPKMFEKDASFLPKRKEIRTDSSLILGKWKKDIKQMLDAYSKFSQIFEKH